MSENQVFDALDMDMWEEEEDDFLQTGLDYIKYMFEGIENFQDLADALEGAAEYFRDLDKDHKMINPVDGSYVHYERKDGRAVYETVDGSNVIQHAEYPE